MFPPFHKYIIYFDTFALSTFTFPLPSSGATLCKSQSGEKRCNTAHHRCQTAAFWLESTTAYPSTRPLQCALSDTRAYLWYTGTFTRQAAPRKSVRGKPAYPRPLWEHPRSFKSWRGMPSATSGMARMHHNANFFVPG